MSTAQFKVINATIRELLFKLEEAKKGRVDREELLKIVDELEDQIDMTVSQLVPERITDERFNAAMKALKEITGKIKELREHIVYERYPIAKPKVLEVQESIRLGFRLLTLIKAGAPMPIIFQTTPQFLEKTPIPEPIIYTNPMAARIYNVLVRKGEAAVEDIAAELKITDETRDEFNRAVSQLISMGYAKPYLTPDNKIVLKLTAR